MPVLVQRKFSIYSTFLDVTLQIEGEIQIQEGETYKQALLRLHKELEETAAELRRMAGEPKGRGIPLPADYVQIEKGSVIDKQAEQMEIDIDNCRTVEELQALKDRILTAPGWLISYYNVRLKNIKQDGNEAI